MFLKASVVYFWILFLAFCALNISACEGVKVGFDQVDDFYALDQGGADSTLVQLPFPAGVSVLCTQGAGGTHSHTSTSTAHDIDLDTSNSEDQELYAPSSGTARVHLFENTSSGFGNHVNIERDDGTYVVVGHMKTIFVCDGCEVAAGQLLGFEGCTGSCTGDHVHIGLHSGDATLPAEKGTSIPATYIVSSGGTTTTLSGEDFVCGVGTKPEPLGQTYTSALAVAYTHPDGTLVKTGNDAKVYVLVNGARRWIANETVFASMRYDFKQVVLVSDEELNCYPDAGPLSQSTLIDAVRDPSGTRWLIVGGQNASDRYRVAVSDFGWEGVLTSWGLSYHATMPPPNANWNSAYLQNWNTKPGFAEFRPGSVLKEPSNSAVYVAGNHLALPVKNWSTYLLLGFLSRPIIHVPDGSVLAVETQMGNCASGLYCLSVESVGVCGNNSLSMSDGENTATFNMAGFPDQAGSGGQDAQSDSSDASPPPSADPPPAASTPAQPPASNTQNTSSASSCPNNAPACLVDADNNGLVETLLLADSLWTAGTAMHQSAYVYANGGCFDGTLMPGDLQVATDGYYAIDFSKFASSCASQLTLISGLSSDGQPLNPNMSNWLWWQNASFCAQGSQLCNLMNNGHAWEEWLLSVSWNPQTGLTPNGNGFTQNAQL
ncbi:MAG: M23 family metallopeptidase [Patescibacteria group bacterium]